CGDGARADQLFQECLILFRQLDGVRALIRVPAHLVQTAILLGDTELARARLNDCLALETLWLSEGHTIVILNAAALLAEATGQLERAAHLFGCGMLVSEGAFGLFPGARDLEAQAMARTRAALGEEAWSAAVATGRALTLEQAIEEARV